ncbi:MAG: translation initiation factor IF-3 [bacterium]|nr:translation initiation factor IF-3 [bacterium]
MKGPRREAPGSRDQLMVNHRIRAREVRVVDERGGQLGVLPLPIALQKAKDLGLDLVQIAPTAVPPVCKIIDYGKFKYQLKKKTHDAKKHQTVSHLKEVKLSPRTEEHDLQFKIRHIKRFLEEGDKAKVSVVFRGREIVYKNLGAEVMNRILKDLEGVAKVEYPPKMEGRAMIMVLSPGNLK